MLRARDACLLSFPGLIPAAEIAAVVRPQPGFGEVAAPQARAAGGIAQHLARCELRARFRNPSLRDAVGTGIIRQVVRAAQAQAQYRALCTAHGTPVECGTMTGWLVPSPETVLDLGDVHFAAVGLDL